MRRAKCKVCPGEADNIVVLYGTENRRERYCKKCFTKKFVKCS